MKRKKSGCFAGAGCLCFFVLVPLILFLALNGQEQLKWLPLDTETNIMERLTDYKPLVQKELEKEGLEQYTSLLLGMIYQESKGRGKDPMQSSESLGLKRNEINDPETSIKQGVHHFSVMYKRGQKKGVDLATIIQSYNMGSGYIDYVSKHGGKHTEKLAKDFSEKQVKQNPDLYNCGGNKNNFRYPYCYGDYSYTEKVMERTKKVEEKIEGITLRQ
ncbi:membrane protein [Bacillus glycinifermentans]|uniref:lysozyme family protein n=1 Tax=Bacillus glycinifermentans TaxID=1664069 RepID=UPI00065496AF|nr:lysozyme family protein [Bacillus glycinifermentans]KMM60074.1 membrane protein [Bacillus glycinifermentans]MEC0494877.1 lysozyme family protein [Bacillus glycinifermentans]MEC0540979.1 lysozyme family protein [Bacillus glycinifermentans]MEC3609218.1 lysozyme family protein [Bacillus glycinifermentans]UOY89382.1 lysozyme family protein [Bacillus glycinifermentans]